MSEEELIAEFGEDGWYELEDEIYRRYSFTPMKVELIKEGMTGEFFEPGNQKELEEKIRNLWGDSERLEEYTRNCKETDFLNLDKYFEKLLQIYGGLKA